MDNLHKSHLERVKTAVAGTYGLANLDKYIEEKTYLNGKKFSFKGHEFQRDILKGQAPTEITVKIAQVGLSEITYRLALAACRVIDDFSVIYTFPNASDAGDMCKTRIDPIVKGSPDLLSAININLDNSEIKQFGRNSFLYMKGTRSQAGAISVPADMIIHDEWDRSDTTVASMYIARLQHKPHKLRRIFSTPTVKKFGILKEAEGAKRYKHFGTCTHCSHKWLPDYFEDVKIPGYDGSLEELNAQNIIHTQWKKAYLACPRCGKDPQLTYESMEWVLENPNQAFEAVARFISPFTVPEVMTIPYLVHNSTEYKKYSEFKNQGLGMAAEEENESITESDINKAIIKGDFVSSDVHFFAADMGIMCHAMVGKELADGSLVVVHKERIPLAKFEDRRSQLLRQYRCVLSVHDSQPYVDMISRLTRSDPNAYGAIFAEFKAGAAVRVQEEEEDVDEGKMNFRIAKLRRTMCFDALLEMFKRNEIIIGSNEEDHNFTQQMLSLKRIQKFDKAGGLEYAWEKTDENDHFHFTLLYLWVAAKLRGTAKGTSSLLATMPLVTKVRMKNS